MQHEGQRERTQASGAKSAVAERRKHKRFLEEVRVRYRDIEGVEPSQWGLSRDLSLGGLCLIAEQPVPVGCHLAIEIHFRDETVPVLALGRVVRGAGGTVADRDAADPDECVAGVQFLWISEEDRANLRRLSNYFREKYAATGTISPEPGVS